MKKKYFFVLVFFLFISCGCFSQKEMKYTAYEKTCIGLFNDFMSYIKDHIQQNTGISDSVQAIYNWNSYLFTESKIDSPAKLNCVERELGTFTSFSRKGKIKNWQKM